MPIGMLIPSLVAFCAVITSALVIREQAPTQHLALDVSKTSPLRAWAHRKVDSHCFEERTGRAWSGGIQSLMQLGKTSNPGAGMDDVVPFKTILKDGFAATDCLLDEMYVHGDKFYDNRHSYKLDRLNVSIIHYAAVVPREDREPMTPDVCFDFCRTVPDMGFFGIVNGRDCYCTPYFRQMAGSSESCTSPCEGDPTNMCGGKSKSQVYEMHMCADTVGDLKNGIAQLGQVSKDIVASAKTISDMAKQAEKESQDLQKLMLSIGDTVAANNLRKASVEAGELMKVAKQADAAKSKIEAAEKKAGKLLGGAFLQEGGPGKHVFSDYKKAKEAEAVVDDIADAVRSARAVEDKLEDALEFQKEVATEEGKKQTLNRSSSYYDTYYFVNGEAHTEANWGKDKSTCGGELAGDPIFGISKDECAYACDKMYQTCKAFNHFSKGSGICLLFTAVDSVTQYDMCGHSLEGKCQPPPALLQESDSTSDATSETSVPFPWKTKSTKPNATLFKETVNGMCTTVFGCGGMNDGETISDCSLMDHYECDDLDDTDIYEEDGALILQFSGWLASGKRDSACKVNPEPCLGCKMYSTCSGPYAITEEVLIKKGDVASYTWTSSGQTDNYEVFVGLYSATCGLVDYQFQRGAQQDWKTFELFAPKTDKYYMKFLLASYDGSGGGAVGADLSVKDVKQTKASVPRIFEIGAKCMARMSDFQGTSIKPDPTGKCDACLKTATKRCLKPDGTFPVPEVPKK